MSVLKRAVRDLVELGLPEEVSRTKLKNSEEELSEAALVRKRMEDDRIRQEQRTKKGNWLREVVVGRCWL